MKALLLISLILAGYYVCADAILAGLPPDLTGLVGLGAVAVVATAGAFAVGRWSRG